MVFTVDEYVENHHGEINICTVTLCKIDLPNFNRFEFRGKENNLLRIYSTIAIISSPKNYLHH